MRPYITIGRSSRCDIIVPDEKVSREHARLYVSGNAYVFENLGKNGSVINGRLISGGKTGIAPGTEVLLSGRIPIPWAQIYTLLPLRGSAPYAGSTVYEPGGQVQPAYNDSYSRRGIEAGWAILAFLLPIAGWIMYFIWKDDTPRRASQAAAIAWVAFFINLILIISAR